MSRLRPGDAAPPFSLQDQHGRNRTLAEFGGRRLFVYFYPEADTAGCTTQSCAVRDARLDLTGLGVDVVGISPDMPDDQSAFDEKFSLGFPLLSDPDHETAEAWGTWREKSPFVKRSMGVVRSAFLVAEDATITNAWYKISPARTVPELMRSLASG